MAKKKKKYVKKRAPNKLEARIKELEETVRKLKVFLPPEHGKPGPGVPLKEAIAKHPLNKRPKIERGPSGPYLTVVELKD